MKLFTVEPLDGISNAISSAHGFFKKWLQNHPKFLLHFLIHIDALMLCSKFELIPTSIFQVTAILRKHQKSEKYLRL